MGRIWKLTGALATAALVVVLGCDGGTLPPDPNNGGEFLNNSEDECAEFRHTLLVESASTATFESNDGPASGMTVGIPPGVLPDQATVTIRCHAGPIVPEGFTALSRVFTIDSLPGVRPEAYSVTLPFDAGAFPEGARPNALRIFVRLPGGQVRAPAFPNIQESLTAGLVRFNTHVFGEYQVGVANDAGTMVDRRYAFRAIAGVSMGAGGAAMVGYRNADDFDIIGALGGAADWQYLVHYLRGAGMGGFCTDADPADESTWACDTFTPTQEFEHAMHYDEWYFSTGSGTGGTFDRQSYQEIFSDLSYAFGNMAYYNPDNPYLPPGIPEEDWHRPDGELCPSGGAIIREGYYDDEYNPDGSRPVIAFCDGTGDNDRSRPFERACDIDPEDGINDQPNKGLYAGPEAQRRPMNIALAVDYNDNGVRDAGEPVIRNFWEPYDDWGTDGVASTGEDGYDPVTNPDPAGDDYHFAYNPFGAEGNWIYDDGEPYRDYGLDGVEGTPQIGDGGYDWGEGNGQFDANPNLLELWKRNPRGVLGDLSGEDRANVLHHTTLYADGGVRDLFNFAVSTNQLAGAVHAHGGNVRIYDDFTRLAQRDTYTDIDVTKIDYENLGEHVMVRYGDPNADKESICLGDGKHVGEVFQTINRLLIMLGFITNRMPGGDFTVLDPPYSLASGDYSFHSEALGKQYRYSIAYPPGYEYTQCNDGLDNDGDGRADGDDTECYSGDHNNEGGPNSLARCADGIDNDLDGAVDDADSDCTGEDDDAESEFFEGKEFPVVYLLHGYGQSPADLKPSLLVLTGYMGGGFWPKAILVFPDGFCGETVVTQCNDGIDNDGDGLIDGDDDGCDGSNAEGGENLPACADGVDNDLDGVADFGGDNGCSDDNDDNEADCVQGTFYTDHAVYPNGTQPGPAFEGALMDLVGHVDESYRTRKPEIVQVPR
jgi:hypothetical protein